MWCPPQGDRDLPMRPRDGMAALASQRWARLWAPWEAVASAQVPVMARGLSHVLVTGQALGCAALCRDREQPRPHCGAGSPDSQGDRALWHLPPAVVSVQWDQLLCCPSVRRDGWGVPNPQSPPGVGTWGAGKGGGGEHVGPEHHHGHDISEEVQCGGSACCTTLNSRSHATIPQRKEETPLIFQVFIVNKVCDIAGGVPGAG